MGFHSLHCTVSPIKMTTLLQGHNENTVKPACFMFFMKARPVYEISQQYQPTKLTCLTNVTMKSSYRRQNTIIVLREEGLLWHSSSSSCNIWPLFYFIDLQRLYIPCLPLLIFSMTSCNASFTYFFQWRLLLM